MHDCLLKVWEDARISETYLLLCICSDNYVISLWLALTYWALGYYTKV